MSGMRHIVLPILFMTLITSACKSKSSHSEAFSVQQETPRFGARVVTIADLQQVQVKEVASGSPAEAGGIKADDCIFEIDGEKVRSEADYARILDSKAGGAVISVGISICYTRLPGKWVNVKLGGENTGVPASQVPQNPQVAQVPAAQDPGYTQHVSSVIGYVRVKMNSDCSLNLETISGDGSAPGAYSAALRLTQGSNTVRVKFRSDVKKDAWSEAEYWQTDMKTHAGRFPWLSRCLFAIQ